MTLQRDIFVFSFLWFSGLLLASWMLIAGAATAQENRTDVLSQSSLFEKLAADGVWDAEVSGSQIEYTCLTCDGEISARLEVIAPYDADVSATPQERYLTELRQRCSDLTAQRSGRCIGTREIAVRPSLRGFRSETEMPTHREIEVVFFYHDQIWPGPELLKTTITISDSASLSEESVEMFMWHMARLTLYW